MDTSFEQLPLSAKRRIDGVCARFEAAWRDGRPQFASFVADESGQERAVLLAELLLIDIEYRRRAGETPRASEYQAIFVGHELIVRTLLPAASKGDTSAGADPAQTVRAPGPLAGRRPVQVPGYEMLGELGRGGMGVVYKARHLALNRLVALKFILAGTSAPSRHIERFRREAEVVARLRHPNVVQIYDIGEVEGQFYLALEYAEGGSLRERLGGTPMEPRAAAMMLEPLARAVQHAHRQGIVHRDLKPANILLAVGGDSVALGNRPLPDYRPAGLDLPRSPELMPALAACTPKITDFGLARMLDHEQPKSELGVAAGTPQYMAPEQACAEPEAGPLIDVWALGTTLYELLTGRPPFRAATARETLRLVVDVDPVPPTQLQPSVPRDLETICLKCLEKDPSRRYAGARELAQDIRRFLDGEAIHARRIGMLERLGKWARRRPWRAAGALLLVLSGLAAVGGATAAMRHAFHGWAVARRQAGEAGVRASDAELETQRAHRDRQQAEEDRLDAQRQAARLLLDQAQTQGLSGDPDRAAHDLLTGLRLSRGRDTVLDRLFRANLGGWLTFVHPLEQVIAVREAPLSLALTAERRLYLGGRDGVVRQRDRDGQAIGGEWMQADAVRFLTFSRDGKRVLLGEPRRVVLRDVAAGEELGRTESHPRPVTAAVFAADGKSFYTGCADGLVRRWNEDGTPVEGLLKHPMPACRLDLSPDGSTLAVALAEVGGGKGALWLWDVGKALPTSRTLAHPGGVLAVAFHPNSRRLFTGCEDGRAREWDTVAGRQIPPAFELGRAPVHVQPTPDGRTLLTVSREEVARLWEIPGRRALGVFPGALPATRLSRDGGALAVAMHGEVRIHTLARALSRPAKLPPRAPPPGNPISAFAVAADGKFVVFGEPSADRGWRRDVQPAKDVRPPWRQALGRVVCVVLDREGRIAAVASREGDESAVQLWDVATGKSLQAPWRLPTVVRCLAFSADGQELAAGDVRGVVRRWAVKTGAPREPRWSGTGSVGALAYAPGDAVLAIGLGLDAEGRGEVRVWDANREREIGEAIAHPRPVEALTFSSDGKTLLVAGPTARLWNFESRRPLTPAIPRVTASRFARAGQAVLVGTSDGHVYRFRANGDAIPPAVPHSSPVLALDLSMDDRLLLVGGRDGTVSLWDLDGSPRPIGPALVTNRPALAVQFAQDSRSCFTLSDDGDLRTWPLPRSLAGPVEDIERRVLVWTGREIDAAGALSPLSHTAWMLGKARLSPVADLKPAPAAWHDARARDSRQDGDLFGERWHLDRLIALQPGDQSLYRRRAVVLARQGVKAGALADLRSAGGPLAVELECAAATCDALGDRDTARWLMEQEAKR